jgi:hypothetical protein
VLNLCDRVMVLSHGATIYYGEPEEAVSRYIAAINAAPGQRWGRRPAAGETPIDRPGAYASADGDAAGLILARDVIGKRREHRHGSGKLRVIAARVTNEQGLDTVRVPMGGVLSFHVLLEAFDHVEAPRTGIRFFDRFNNLVFGAGTLQMGEPLPPMDAGDRVVVRFDVTMDVAPGQYSFGLGAGVPAPEENINAGLAHDRIDTLGPIIVGITRDELRPFYGLARLPMRVSITGVGALAGKETSP